MTGGEALRGLGGLRGGVPKAVFDHWLTRLRCCDSEIGSVATGTEGAFLVIGARLRDFLCRAGKISENAFSAASMMSRDEIVRSIDSLNLMLRRLEDGLRLSESENRRRTEKLKGILAMSENAMKALDDFSGAAGAPAPKGPSANETLRTPGGAADRLGHIQGEIGSLRAMVERMLSGALALDLKQHGASDAAFRHTATSLLTLTEKYGCSTVSAYDIRERSGGISRSMNEVVVSLQFHDITRQRLERTRAVLGQMLERLEVEAARAGGEPGAHAAAEVHDFCGLQAERLERATEEFVHAVTRVVEGLRRISAHIAEMSEETRRLVKEAGEGSRDCLTDIRKTTASVSETLCAFAERASVHRELSSALNSVLEAASLYADDIKRIRDGLPCHKGGGDVSGDRAAYVRAEATADLVSGLLMSVASFVEDVSEGAGPGIGEKTAGEMQKDLESLTAVLRTLNGDVRNFLLYADSMAVCLTEDIMETVKRIGVHKTVAAAIGEVVTDLREIAKEAGSLMPPASVHNAHGGDRETRTGYADETRQWEGHGLGSGEIEFF